MVRKLTRAERITLWAVFVVYEAGGVETILMAWSQPDDPSMNIGLRLMFSVFGLLVCIMGSLFLRPLWKMSNRNRDDTPTRRTNRRIRP